jgi:hypothetical protein
VSCTSLCDYSSSSYSKTALTCTQEKLRLNLHSLSVSELLEYGRICVTTSDFCFIAENLRILKFCLLNYYDGKTDVKSHVFQYTKLINYTTRKFAKKLYIK